MNNKKIFDLGLICGRFGHEHIGHIQLFDTCISLCKETLILVGSSQESQTLRNPFSIDTRIKIIQNTYPNLDEKTLLIKGIKDLTHEHDITYDWGRYVKSQVELHKGKFADLMVYGNDESRRNWFDPKDLVHTAELIIPRNNINISATKIRGYLLINNEENWKKYVHPNIYNLYNDLRNELLNVPIYQEIYNKIKENPSIENFLNVYKILEKKDKLEKINK